LRNGYRFAVVRRRSVAFSPSLCGVLVYRCGSEHLCLRRGADAAGLARFDLAAKMFWAFIIVFVPLAMLFSRYELGVLDHPEGYGLLLTGLLVPALLLWFINRHRARFAVLYYEESEPEVITTIGIGAWRPLTDDASIQDK